MRLLFIFLFCSTIFSCKETLQKTTKNNTSIKKKINGIVDKWHQAAATANYEDFFKEMDSISVFIGTDALENWNKKDFATFCKPHFDRGRAWNFTPLERNVYLSKNQDIAWFDELLKTWMGVCRGSGVLEKEGVNWKIKHYVLSITIPNDNVKQVLNINKEKNDTIISRLQKVLQ